MVKIGFIDSGLGGLSVIRELRKLNCACKAVYIYDNKFHPYGNRSREELMAITFRNIETLVAEGVEAVVLACNTITGACADGLRKTFSIPIIGTEPPIKPALVECDSIAVLATSYTKKSEKFRRLIGQYEDKKIYLPNVDDLARLIERENNDYNKLHRYLSGALIRMPDIDGVALGCTHYYYAVNVVRAVLPYAKIYESSSGVARRIRDFVGCKYGSIELQIITTGEHIEEEQLKKFL